MTLNIFCVTPTAQCLSTFYFFFIKMTLRDQKKKKKIGKGSIKNIFFSTGFASFWKWKRYSIGL